MYITRKIEFIPYYYTNWAGLSRNRFLKIWFFNYLNSDHADSRHWQIRFIGFTISFRFNKTYEETLKYWERLHNKDN